MGDRPMAGGGSVEIVSVGGIPLHSATSNSSSPHSVGSPLTPPALQSDGPGIGSGSGPGSGAESGENEGLTEIKKRIERAKRYPQFARSQGLEGTAEVSFQIRADGSLATCQLAQSSGSRLLDEEAVATVQRGVPYPFYAAPLQVKVDFRAQAMSE